MDDIRPYAESLARLKKAGLRPTRQRLALAKLLFEHGPRHITAEQLHTEALEAGVRVSLATVYNTLNQFTRAGLLREVVVDPSRAYFDTNTTEHHHYYLEETGELWDIPDQSLSLVGMPVVPDGLSLASVDVIVRVRNAPHSQSRAGLYAKH